MNSSLERIPAPDALPEGGVEREHRREPEERQQRREKQHEEVGQEPCPRGNGRAVRRDARLEVEEAEDEQHSDDEWRKHPRGAPSGRGAGRHGEDEQDQRDCGGRELAF